jgi:hypothetical protein
MRWLLFITAIRAWALSSFFELGDDGFSTHLVSSGKIII